MWKETSDSSNTINSHDVSRYLRFGVVDFKTCNFKMSATSDGANLNEARGFMVDGNFLIIFMGKYRLWINTEARVSQQHLTVADPEDQISKNELKYFPIQKSKPLDKYLRIDPSKKNLDSKVIKVELISSKGNGKLNLLESL